MGCVATIMPSQITCDMRQRLSEVCCIGQCEGWSPLLPSSCNAKGGIPSSRRYLPTDLPTLVWSCTIFVHSAKYAPPNECLCVSMCMLFPKYQMPYNLCQRIFQAISFYILAITQMHLLPQSAQSC